MVLIFMWSFFIKGNAASRLMEHILIGVGAGYLFVTYTKSLFDYAVVPLMKGNLLWIAPIALALTYFSALSPKHAWISRYGIAWLSGTTMGVVTSSIGEAQIMQQIRATMFPLNTVNSIVTFLIVILGLFAFVFTTKNKIAVRVSRAGRAALMISFGAGFASYVLWCQNVWLSVGESLVTYPGTLAVPIALVIVAIATLPKERLRKILGRS